MKCATHLFLSPSPVSHCLHLIRSPPPQTAYDIYASKHARIISYLIYTIFFIPTPPTSFLQEHAILCWEKSQRKGNERKGKEERGKENSKIQNAQYMTIRTPRTCDNFKFHPFFEYVASYLSVPPGPEISGHFYRKRYRDEERGCW